MKVTREWCMPHRETFSVFPIDALLKRYLTDVRAPGWIDPFARRTVWAEFTNDIDPNCGADNCMDWRDFLSRFPDGSLDGILLDPPYSHRQIMTAYGGKIIGKMVPMTEVNKEAARVIRSGGMAISFGWNSNGVGKKRGFEIVEVLVVAHGGHHNDTIVTVERKR